MFNKTPELRKDHLPSRDSFQALSGPHKATLQEDTVGEIFTKGNHLFMSLTWIIVMNVYSCSIVYCFQSEEKRTPFEHQPRHPIMEAWFFLRYSRFESEPFVARLSKKQEALVSSAWGGEVSPCLLIGWHWAFMIGWERCGRGGRDKTKVKEKGPKVCRRSAETVSIAWHQHASVNMIYTVSLGSQSKWYTENVHVYKYTGAERWELNMCD